jgi:phospholipase C
MKRNWFALAAGAAALAAGAWIAVPGVSSANSAGKSSSSIPHYQHIIEIMMENTSYGTIIGNPLAPNINRLANKYGLATNYFGVTHPSEPNYVASIGGSFFGIQDDNQFYCTPALASADPNCAGTTVNHTISAQSLADQLTAAGMTWKGYFQNLPPTPPAGQLVMTGPNANGPYTFKWPSSAVALYASKHNPFVNFTGTQGDVANMVPDTQLFADLANNALPNYSLVVPDQCHDMHGTGTCGNTNQLISMGDTYVGNLVDAIRASAAWQSGRNAIVITWDEDDFSDQGQPGTGCCGADPGGGHVPTIVITNQSNQHVSDGTAYNHYSLLKTMEAAFGLPPLAHAGDADVPLMTPLFNAGS